MDRDKTPAPRCLVTGANGFVGTVLCDRLCSEGMQVVEVGRSMRAREHEISGVTSDRQFVEAQADFIGLAESWPTALTCDYAVHLAARVHVMHESVGDALPRYRETNVAGTLRVAEAARRAGVKRFVYVSSVKALGDSEPCSPSRPWRESDMPAPQDPYGQSKAEAESALGEFCKQYDMECVIIRPPLVYGPGVRANFRQLMSVVARGIPLPLSKVRAQRSMIFVDNLVDAISECARHPAAAGQCFHVSDGKDLSVAEIVTLLGEGMGHRARLLALPLWFLTSMARLSGKREQADRILRPLRLDITYIRETLGWLPPTAAEDGLRRTARWYRNDSDSHPDGVSR